MLAREIMTSPVITVEPDMPIRDAMRVLDRHDITAVPVVDEDERLVGIVSEADLLRGGITPDPRAHARPIEGGHREPAGKTVADVMTSGVLTVREGTDASDIARMMLETGIKSVPVTHGQRVVGIVSRRDLIRALASTDERIQDEIRQLFAEAGVKGWKAEVDEGKVRIVGHGSARDARLAATLARTVTGVSEVHAPDDAEQVTLPRKA